MTSARPSTMAHAYERLSGMVTGFRAIQTVRAAAVFNLADHLVAGTNTAEFDALFGATLPATTK